MGDENKMDEPKVQADNNSIAIGSIEVGGDVSGNITIGDTGYTAEEVSVLITQITATFQPKPFDGRCPYKGLDVFEEEDAELFFGREKLVDDLVSRVKDSRTVFVTGPSGSGKSSLVRAGLIHTLKLGAIKSSERWLYATMKPGRDPLESLATAFSRLKSPELGNYFRQHVSEIKVLHECAESVLSDNKNQHLMLFIDQFEEVFTQIGKEAERMEFLDLLTYAATIENGRVIILFSMRSDFVSNCATYPQLNALLNQQFVQIGAMQPEELVSAIAQPALRVGLRIDPDLIAQIINEMKGEPGALPLMQFALKDLFDFQQEKSGVIALTLNDYLQRGGIHKALERHADDSFSILSKNEQELARSIFSGLIEIGRGTQDTKRTALFDELVPANTKAEDIESIVQKLADARLVTTDEQAGKETVTISHEKLIDAWPWLKKLVNENRDVIASQNEISADAKEWEEHHRDASYLYTGGRLSNAREQLGAKKLVLSGVANEFVQAGYKKQRQGQVAKIFSIAAAIGLIVVGVLVVSYQSIANSKKLAEQSVLFANTQQTIANTAEANANLAATAQVNAEKQAQIALARQLAAQSVSLRDSQFDLSLLLSIEAFLTADDTRTRNVLLENTQIRPQIRQYLQSRDRAETTGGTFAVAFSPDAKILASSECQDMFCGQSKLVFWNAITGESIEILSAQTEGNPIYRLAFSPDGMMLASGSMDGTIVLWDVATHQPIGAPLSGHANGLWQLAFSPDGKILSSSSIDGFILWDVDTHDPLTSLLTDYYCASFGPDERNFAIGFTDKAVTLLDLSNSHSFVVPFNGITAINCNPNGKTIAIASKDNVISLLDVNTHQFFDQPHITHDKTIYWVTFSADGNLLAFSDTKDIIVWDLVNFQPIGQPLTGDDATVIWNIAFSPDGKTLASARRNGTIILWDLFHPTTIGQMILDEKGSIASITFSPDGKILAMGICPEKFLLENSCQTYGEIILWDVDTSRAIGQPLILSENVSSLTFSPDGKTLVSNGAGNVVMVWDVDTGNIVGRLTVETANSVSSLVLSPDGKILAVDYGPGFGTTLWDFSTRQPIISLGPGIQGPAFSPDGKRLASYHDAAVYLWNLETKKRIEEPLTGQFIDVLWNLEFSPNGKILAASSADGTIGLWDMESLQPIDMPFKSADAWPVSDVHFSPDGNILASINSMGTLKLWNVESAQPFGFPLLDRGAEKMAFSPDGRYLASGSGSGTVILWDMNPEMWKKRNCQRVGRNLTRAEWQQYIGDALPYQAVCPNLPIEADAIVTPTP